MKYIFVFKNLISVVFAIFLFLFFPKMSFASEGRFSLNGNVSCEGVSIWRWSSYEILGRCNGLSYPYSDQFDEYVLWSQPEGASSPQIIGSIQRGIIDGSINKRFSKLFITAENSSSPQGPSGIEVSSGSIQGFNFQEPTLTQETTIPIPQTPTPRPIGFNFGSTIPIGSLLLFVLIIVVLAVIVFRAR